MEGSLNLVFVIISGGWKGNLSRSKMSKLNVSMLVATVSADFAISSYELTKKDKVSQL